jgi:hypothetical protein
LGTARSKPCEQLSTGSAGHGGGAVSWRGTSSSAYFDAAERASSTLHPDSRTSIQPRNHYRRQNPQVSQLCPFWNPHRPPVSADHRLELSNGLLIAATRRLLKDRSPLQYSGFSRFNVLPRNRPGRSEPPAPASAPAGTTRPTDVLHPYERQPAGLAVNGYLDSDAESRDREEYLRKRSSHLFQGRPKYRTAHRQREGDEPAFQAQLTGFRLYPKNAISYPTGRCRKFVIHVRPQRRADVPSSLPGTGSFHCPAEELSRPVTQGPQSRGRATV